VPPKINHSYLILGGSGFIRNLAPRRFSQRGSHCFQRVLDTTEPFRFDCCLLRAAQVMCTRSLLSFKLPPQYINKVRWCQRKTRCGCGPELMFTAIHKLLGGWGFQTTTEATHMQWGTRPLRRTFGSRLLAGRQCTQPSWSRKFDVEPAPITSLWHKMASCVSIDLMTEIT
jgi:hypothetical protein